MTTVRQLLDQKGRNTWSIHPDATVFDAVAKMAEKDIGSLVVMEVDEFVGLITERHYARNVVLEPVPDLAHSWSAPTRSLGMSVHGTKPTWPDVRVESAFRIRAEVKFRPSGGK
jgi:hypothetical protein